MFLKHLFIEMSMSGFLSFICIAIPTFALLVLILFVRTFFVVGRYTLSHDLGRKRNVESTIGSIGSS